MELLQRSLALFVVSSFFFFWKIDTVDDAINDLHQNKFAVIGRLRRTKADRSRGVELDFTERGFLRYLFIDTHMTERHHTHTPLPSQIDALHSSTFTILNSTS